MVGYGDVMLTTLQRSQPHVTTDLAGDSIAEGLERSSEMAPREVSGKPHLARTSSFTKWSRMTFGPVPSSK